MFRVTCVTRNMFKVYLPAILLNWKQTSRANEKLADISMMLSRWRRRRDRLSRKTTYKGQACRGVAGCLIVCKLLARSLPVTRRS